MDEIKSATMPVGNYGHMAATNFDNQALNFVVMKHTSLHISTFFSLDYSSNQYPSSFTSYSLSQVCMITMGKPTQ